MDLRAKTIFCDIDGTLVKHFPPVNTQNPNHKMILLDGTLEKLSEWDKLGYNIILVTGRREGLRQQTERQLQETGIIYDSLIMGVGGGARYVINDCKPDGEPTAFSIPLIRNEGIKNIKI